jgi:hypothetical protein
VKVIFLDFDGVLNSSRFYAVRPSHEFKLDRVAVSRVNELLERTGAKVVVSSVWRIGRSVEALQDVLEEYGFRGRVIGRTPQLRAAVRGEEIREWLTTHPNIDVTSFVIIDDDADMVDLSDRLVQTTHRYGITRRHVLVASRMLGEPIVKKDWFPVTDPDFDAPDGAVVDGFVRVGDKWVRVKRRARG